MAMAVENRQQVPMGALSYEHQMRYNGPHFTNPWQSSAAPMYQQLPPVSSPVADKMPRSTAPQHHMQYQLPPTTAATNASLLGTETYDHALGGQNLLDAPRYPDYPATTQQAGNVFAPTSAPQYQYSQTSPYAASFEMQRRPSYTARAPQNRDAFNDALDASRGMVAMSQDLTPRNIYGNHNVRAGSAESYGFPSTHSTHSSISSASTYPASYGYSGSVASSLSGSVDGSVTDYSSAGEEVASRTLPRPQGFPINGNMPPAASSMMSQFNSKVAPSTQKKHKCKICDKRFTRPSSLQTHMYSHTGEKPFACDAEGCGRNFSVVSNLRRHKKVHKNEQQGHQQDRSGSSPNE